MKLDDLWPIPFVLVAVLGLIALVVWTSDDGRHRVYCERGGSVFVTPDSKEQIYSVKCVRTRP